jgi:hypothetical protein
LKERENIDLVTGGLGEELQEIGRFYKLIIQNSLLGGNF